MVSQKISGSVAYPLVAIIGDVGVGKTAKAVDIIRKFYQQNGSKRTIFTNILLFEIPYVELDVNDFENDKFTTKTYSLIINHKDESGQLSYKHFDKTIHHYKQEILKNDVAFEDGLMVIDEGQDLSDAYRFLSSNVVRFNHFISQIRHYDLEFFVITQRLNFISVRLRKLLNYHYEIDYYLYYDKKLGIKTMQTGVIEINYFRMTSEGRNLYKTAVQDLRDNFDYYSTKQMVNAKGGKKTDEIKSEL